MLKKLLATIALTIFTLTAQAQTNTHGVAQMNHASATANIVVSGAMNSKHGHFTGNVTVSSDHAVLNDTKVKGSITVKSNKNNPVLELLCGSKISGDITFDGKSGVVKKSADSVVTGKVINGKTEEITQKDNCE